MTKLFAACRWSDSFPAIVAAARKSFKRDRQSMNQVTDLVEHSFADRDEESVAHAASQVLRRTVFTKDSRARPWSASLVRWRQQGSSRQRGLSRLRHSSRDSAPTARPPSDATFAWRVREIRSRNFGYELAAERYQGLGGPRRAPTQLTRRTTADRRCTSAMVRRPRRPTKRARRVRLRSTRRCSRRAESPPPAKKKRFRAKKKKEKRGIGASGRKPLAVY